MMIQTSEQPHFAIAAADPCCATACHSPAVPPILSDAATALAGVDNDEHCVRVNKSDGSGDFLTAINMGSSASYFSDIPINAANVTTNESKNFTGEKKESEGGVYKDTGQSANATAKKESGEMAMLKCTSGFYTRV